MYKTKLQELCQKKQWAMPDYAGMKCGPDHKARYGASVYVNGTSFDSLVAFNSSKQAYDHAAKLAFLHFTAPSDNEDENLEETHEGLKIQSNFTTRNHGIESQYKNQLLKYVKKRNLELPSFSSESGGLNASLFKAKVRAAERIFESPKPCNTLTEAENSAAKTALTSVLVDNFQKDEQRGYKSLLQEICQREGFCMPVYRTTNLGAPHKPMFCSAVELEGEIFHGKPAKSKKLAELEAAMVAYLALIERGESRIGFNSGPSDGLWRDSPQSLEHKPKANGELTLPRFSTSDSSSTSKDAYLLCNKVRVYRKFPYQAFPEGVVVLPVGDEKWVAISLEFPNEKIN